MYWAVRWPVASEAVHLCVVLLSDTHAESQDAVCSGSTCLDEVLAGQLVAGQEDGHVLALITLQLDDLAQLVVLYHIPVAAETLQRSIRSGRRQHRVRQARACAAVPFLKAFSTFL